MENKKLRILMMIHRQADNSPYCFYVHEQAKALLSEMELGTDEDMASISRELTSAGKNICRINGTVVPLTKLRQTLLL